MRRARNGGSLAALLAAAALGCSSDFDTDRVTPPRGTLGQELFIALCDRVAAQALPEDVTGASWHAVCHPDASGNFATTVDQTRLPPLDPNAVDVDGNPVPLALQQRSARTASRASRRSPATGVEIDRAPSTRRSRSRPSRSRISTNPDPIAVVQPRGNRAAARRARRRARAHGDARGRRDGAALHRGARPRDERREGGDRHAGRARAVRRAPGLPPARHRHGRGAPGARVPAARADGAVAAVARGDRLGSVQPRGRDRPVEAPRHRQPQAHPGRRPRRRCSSCSRWAAKSCGRRRPPRPLALLRDGARPGRSRRASSSRGRGRRSS